MSVESINATIKSLEELRYSLNIIRKARERIAADQAGAIDLTVSLVVKPEGGGHLSRGFLDNHLRSRYKAGLEALLAEMERDFAMQIQKAKQDLLQLAGAELGRPE